MVEDHEVLRSGLRWLLTRVPWVERCDDRAHARRGARDRAVRRRARRRRPRPRRLRAPERHRRADRPADLALGRRADARRPRGRRPRRDRQGAPARELLRAVHELAGGGTCEPEPAPPGDVRFAPREREILRLVSAGLTNAEIGAALFLAPGHDQAPHARALRQARRAQPRRRRAHRAPARRPRRPPRAVPRAGRARCGCSSPTRSTSAAPASCSPSRGASGSRPAPARARVEDALEVAARLQPQLVLAGDEAMAAAFPGALLLRDDGSVEQPADGPASGGGVSARERDVLTRSRRAPPTRRSPASSGSPRTPSSSTPRRSSASSACAIAPRPCGGPTSSGCWPPRRDQQPLRQGVGTASVLDGPASRPRR